MSATNPFTHTRYAALLIMGVASAAFALPAEAGRKNPAPIVFAGTGQAAAPIPARNTGHSNQGYNLPQGYRVAGSTPAMGATAAPKPGKAGKRIEFRYPDQPQTVYGDGQARRSNSDAPIAFSSAKAAVSPTQARQYASVKAPQYSTPPQSHDPAITRGGFDARAAARQVATQAPIRNPVSTPVETQPLAALNVSVPQPNAQMGQGGVSGAQYDETGLAVVYDNAFEGAPTANGELFSQQGMTAAHPSLPLPSLVQVVNLASGQEIVVRVNDRGPFEDGALLQLSNRAATVIGVDGAGRSDVRVRYLGPAPAVTPVATPAMASMPMPAPIQAVATPPAPAPMPTYKPAPIMAASQQDLFLQVGSFSDIGNAQALHRALGSNMPVIIVPARVNGADFFRVRVGPFDNRQTAEALGNHLRAQGIADGRVLTGDR